MAGNLARAIHGIPVVASSTERDALYPTPEQDQRVFNKATGAVERWTGSAWQADVVGFPRSAAEVTAGVTPSNYAYPVGNVLRYGAIGNGVTDDTTAIKAAEAARPTGATLTFPATGSYLVSSAYDGTSGARGSLLKISKAGVWDFTGATLLWGGPSGHKLTTGGDGAYCGVVNVTAPGVVLRGIIDCQSNAACAIAAQDTVLGKGLNLDVTIQNTLEASAVWTGLAYTVSSDVTGVAISSARAANISGKVFRPNCPMMDSTLAITSHADTTAFLFGAAGTINGNSTGTCLAMSDSGDFVLQYPGRGLGLLNTPLSEANVHMSDLVLHELGNASQETYGHPNIGSAYGTGNLVGESTRGLGHLLKSCLLALYHYNVVEGSTTPPNVWMDGGTAVANGRLGLDGKFYRKANQAGSTFGTGVVLVGGTATVNTTAVTGLSVVRVTIQTKGGTPGHYDTATRTAGTSFTITSSSGTDTSTVSWEMVEPY